jgi:hypothetical protein
MTKDIPIKDLKGYIFFIGCLAFENLATSKTRLNVIQMYYFHSQCLSFIKHTSVGIINISNL